MNEKKKNMTDAQLDYKISKGKMKKKETREIETSSNAETLFIDVETENNEIKNIGE